LLVLKANTLSVFEINRQDDLYVPQLSTSKRLFQLSLEVISAEFKNMPTMTLTLQTLTPGLREKKLHQIMPHNVGIIEKRSDSSRRHEYQSALPSIIHLHLHLHEIQSDY
jgi:hypothetical protein